MAADFEEVTISVLLFFTWVLCIYIILGRGCHILYVYVDVPSNQVTYDFVMDTDLYNSFLLRLRIKSF